MQDDPSKRGSVPTILVRCRACGHEQQSIVFEEDVPPIMRNLLLYGQPEELTCPKCGLQTMEEKG